MRRRPSIEAADLPRIGSPAATTEDRAIQVPCDSLGRCALIARTAPVRADTAQNVLTLHADLAIPSPATMRAAQLPEVGHLPLAGESGNQHHPAGQPQRAGSAAQTQPVDQRAVALHIDLGHVLQQPAPPSDQQQQTAPRVVVVLVHLEVLGEVGDPPGQQCDLRLRGSGVGLMQAVQSPGFPSFGRQSAPRNISINRSAIIDPGCGRRELQHAPCRREV